MMSSQHPRVRGVARCLCLCRRMLAKLLLLSALAGWAPARRLSDVVKCELTPASCALWLAPPGNCLQAATARRLAG